MSEEAEKGPAEIAEPEQTAEKKHEISSETHVKPHRLKHKPQKKEKADTEEVSIDFGKVKNFFKTKKQKEAASEKSDEISFDVKSAKDFFIRHKAVFLILIPLILAIFFRMQTASLPFTDNWAQNTVVNYYKAQIKGQIDQQYPNLPEANKLALVDQQFAEYVRTNKAQLDAQVKDVSQRYKSFFQFEDGKNYMPDIDPYAYLRNAENYLEHGYIGTEKRIVNGTEVQWDTYITAPVGQMADPKTLHPYLLAYLYGIIKIFDPSTTPMDSAMYFPVIFSALSIIPPSFIARKLARHVGRFFGATILAINSSFLGRTLFGHADTDAYNIFFPLYIIWLFLEAFEQRDRIKQAIFAGVAGFFVGLYSFAWTGWWYVFDFVLAMLVIYIIYLFIFNRKSLNDNLKKLAFIIILFVASSAIFVSLLSLGGFPSFVSATMQPLVFTTLKVAAHETLWPNVYTTVAELNPASFGQVIASVGGNLMFLISIIGIALLFFTKKESETEVPFAILVVLWYIGIFYASTKGIRFTMMLAPPFALAFGTALGRIYKKGLSFSEKGLSLNRTIAAIVIIFVFLLLFIQPLRAAQATGRGDVPIINDAWYNSLNKIKLQSAPNAIVNSWWDFGHHFKYFADRAVTFDGGSQNTPMAHWVGKSLLTDDEKLSVGILRMLDCGSNTAFEKLDEKIKDVSVSVKLLYRIVKLSKGDAKKLLEANGLSGSEAENVLQYTHCEPPEDYFITSEDMVGKAGVWAHFGSWDFDRADIWVFAKNMPRDSAIDFITKNMNVSGQEAERLYFEVQGIADEGEANTWIAPWPSYAGQANCRNIENRTISCDNGVKINLTNMDAEVPTQQGIMRPYSLVYASADDVVEKKFDSQFPFSLIFVNRESPFIVLSQPQLARSMFTRLFYFEGYKLEHFKLFSHEQGLTGTNVYVWKVDWEGNGKS